MSESLKKKDKCLEIDVDQGYAESISSLSTPNSGYSEHEEICTPHTQESGIDEDTYTNVQDEIEIYVNNIRKHWTDLKREMNVKTLSKKFASIGWLTITDVGNNKRAIEAEKLLNEVIPKIVSKSDKAQFENVVGEEIKRILSIPSEAEKDHLHSTGSTDKENTRIQNSKELCEEILLPQHVLEIKDNFLQCNIIDLKENIQICSNPGLYAPKNKAIVRQFVDLAIEKAHLGSYQCMVSCIKTLIKKNTKGRLAHLLLKLESDDTDKKKNSDSNNGDIKNITLTLRDVNAPYSQEEMEDEEEDIHAYITIRFDKDNRTTRRLYEVINEKTVSDIQTYVASHLGLECKRIEIGSVIIHLKSLEGKLRSRLRNSMYNGEMEKLLEVIFTNVEVNSLINPGTFHLEMEVRAVKALKVKQDILLHRWDIVADNKSFLVEEIDTEEIAEAFKHRAKYFSNKGLQGDRYMVAKHIIDEIIQNNWQQIFRAVVEENHFTYIQQRLITYERVYKSDTTYLRQNIVTKFPFLIANIDLNEMKDIFIEREIFKKQLFDNIEQTYGDYKEKAIANFLIAVIQSGNDAMLTLIDALFVVQLDDFANDLLNSKPKVVICMKKDEDLTDILVQWSDNLGEDVIIKGSFDLVVNPTEVINRPKSEHITGIEKGSKTFQRKRTHGYDTERRSTMADFTCTSEDFDRQHLYWMNCVEMNQSVRSYSEPIMPSRSSISHSNSDIHIPQFACLSLNERRDLHQRSLQRSGSYPTSMKMTEVRQPEKEKPYRRTHIIASPKRLYIDTAQPLKQTTSKNEFSSFMDEAYHERSHSDCTNDCTSIKRDLGKYTGDHFFQKKSKQVNLMMMEEIHRENAYLGQPKRGRMRYADELVTKTQVIGDMTNQEETEIKSTRKHNKLLDDKIKRMFFKEHRNCSQADKKPKGGHKPHDRVNKMVKAESNSMQATIQNSMLNHKLLYESYEPACTSTTRTPMNEITLEVAYSHQYSFEEKKEPKYGPDPTVKWNNMPVTDIFMDNSNYSQVNMWHQSCGLSVTSPDIRENSAHVSLMNQN